MKKLICVIMCMAILLCGCGKEEDVPEAKEPVFPLPNNLEFGMTYDEAKKAYPDMPPLEDATANDGYFMMEYVDSAFAKEYFSINEEITVAWPSFAYSFNQDKELYEFYTMTIIFSGDADAFYNDVITYYNNVLGVEATKTKSLNSLEAEWETETYGIYLYVSLDNEQSYWVVHDLTNDLSA